MMKLIKEDVDYLISIGFRRSHYANNIDENRVFIKPNGKHPIVINTDWATPVGSEYEASDGKVIGQPAVIISWQTLDDSMMHPIDETPLFLGNVDNFEEFKVILKQVGVND